MPGGRGPWSEPVVRRRRGLGRKILSVIAGVVAGGIVVGLVEALGHTAFPIREGVDFQQLKPGDIPIPAMVAVLVAWALGSLVGGWVAARKAGMAPALSVGAILMAAGIVNMVTIPSPLWFWVGGLAVFLPFAYLGAKLAARRS